MIKVCLAKELTLGSDWECCLKEIHYPRSWNTLDLDEGQFYIHHLIQNTWETKTLPPGHYENNQQVIDAMNKVLSELMVTLELLTTSQIVVFNIPSELELVYSEPLTSLLGLTHPTENCRGPRKYGKYPMNLNRGIDAIYVYSDVIHSQVCHSLVSFPFVVFSGKWRSKSILLQCTLLWQNMCFPQSKCT